LSEAVKADHGFNVESKAIRDLIEIMTSYDKNGRRDFLQFITGSPKLPIGGKRPFLSANEASFAYYFDRI
jgi:E3 ubiquitin-protein ligase TRIP12